MDFNESNATEAVLDSFSKIKDKRLKQIMNSLITHLHQVVKEVEPTEDEWMKDFVPLTDVRASAKYRLKVARNLLTRYFMERSGQSADVLQVVP